MPYIENKVVRIGGKKRREEMDKIVDLMVEQGVRVNGDLNYVLFKFCKKYVTLSYNNYKNYCGELRQCATEIERRIIAKYEDLKILENGDVE